MQQEHGCVSHESEELVAEYLGMPPIAVHEVTTFYNMYNQRAGRAASSSTSAPTCRASCATASTRSSTCAHSLGVEEGGTTADGLFTVQKAECLGACADAPVLLVNDRQMVQLHERRSGSTSWSTVLRESNPASAA